MNSSGQCGPSKKRVVLGFIGSTLDAGSGTRRWDRWRPTVSAGQFEDLRIDRFEIFTQRKFKGLFKTVNEDLATVSPESEVCAVDLPLRDPWNFEEVFGKLYDFARGYPFDPENEEYLIHITTGTHVAQICLFLLTESGHLPGRILQISPPRDRAPDLPNPGTYSIIDLDLSAYDAIAQRYEQESEAGADFLKSGIATKNADFNRMIARIEQVAISSKAPILLLGPTGAGKSHLARRIFELKRERGQFAGGRFVEVNCSTLRGDSAMSAMFGHRKGAFTGAAAERTGLLRSANGGLLFLDEVGELGLDEQSMLLRAIEEKRFLPMGSDTEVESDFQLICGTNRDLIDAVADGQFRADLFARINLWLFDLPGLRDRREDIAPNVTYELDKIGRETGKKIAFNHEGLTAFLRFAESPVTAWTGNFRDLNAALTRLATLSSGKRIGRELVEEEIERLKKLWRPDDGPRDATSILHDVLGEERASRLDRFDRLQLVDVIAVCRSSRSMAEAGRALFSESRKRKAKPNDGDRLRKYLAKFDLDWDSV